MLSSLYSLNIVGVVVKFVSGSSCIWNICRSVSAGSLFPCIVLNFLCKLLIPLGRWALAIRPWRPRRRESAVENSCFFCCEVFPVGGHFKLCSQTEAFCDAQITIWIVNLCEAITSRGLLCCSDAQHWGGFACLPLPLRRVEIIPSGSPSHWGQALQCPSLKSGPSNTGPPTWQDRLQCLLPAVESWKLRLTVPSDRCSWGKRSIPLCFFQAFLFIAVLTW